MAGNLFFTAATRDVGTDSGNVMEVGAFGLGARYGITINDLTENEFRYAPSQIARIMEYDKSTSWLAQYDPSSFLTRYMAVMKVCRDINGSITLMGGSNNKLLYFPQWNGSFGNIVSIAHSGNLLTTTGQSTEYPMTQKAVTDELNTKANWASGNKIITVAGSGADFTTIMGAIAEAMKWRSIDGSVIVEIQSGYLVQEQLFFIDNDYSHINIKAQNGTTIIVDHNSMSVTDFEGLGYSGFIVCARGKSPMFQTQFEFLTRPADTISGAMSVFNGHVYFGNNSGVKRAGRSGAAGSRGGSVTMGNDNDFSGAGSDGAAGSRGGSVTMGNDNDFSGAGSDGAAGSFGGSVTMGNGNDFSGAGGNGAQGHRGGSVTMGDSNDFSGAGESGALGYYGSVTMGSNNDFSGAGRSGAVGSFGGSVTMGNDNDFSGVAAGSYSLKVTTNGFIQTGNGTILTIGRERNQAPRTITTSGLIMG